MQWQLIALLINEIIRARVKTRRIVNKNRTAVIPRSKIRVSIAATILAEFNLARVSRSNVATTLRLISTTRYHRFSVVSRARDRFRTDPRSTRVSTSVGAKISSVVIRSRKRLESRLRESRLVFASEKTPRTNETALAKIRGKPWDKFVRERFTRRARENSPLRCLDPRDRSIPETRNYRAQLPAIDKQRERKKREKVGWVV